MNKRSIKIMKNLKQKAKENSVSLILQTALELMSAKGFDSVSMRDIGRSANISPGLIYNYFESKDDLLRSIFLQGKQEIIQSFQFEKNEIPIIEFENYLNQTFGLIKQNTRFWKLFHSIRNQEQLMSIVSKETEELTQVIFTNLDGLLSRLNLSGKLSVLTLFAMLDGAIAHYILLPNYPIDQVKYEILEIIKGMQNGK